MSELNFHNLKKSVAFGVEILMRVSVLGILFLPVISVSSNLIDLAWHVLFLTFCIRHRIIDYLLDRISFVLVLMFVLFIYFPPLFTILEMTLISFVLIGVAMKIYDSLKENELFHSVVYKISAFFAKPAAYILYVVIKLASCVILPIFYAINGFLQCIITPALLYSWRSQIVKDHSEMVPNVLTFTWGGMFQTAQMNSDHWFSPMNGLHIAFSHQFARDKKRLINYYVEHIRKVIKLNPCKREIRFGGYSMGGAIAAEVMQACYEDKELKNYFENCQVLIMLDRTYKSIGHMIPSIFLSEILKKFDSFVYNFDVVDAMRKKTGNDQNFKVNISSAEADSVLGSAKLEPKDISSNISRADFLGGAHVAKSSCPFLPQPESQFFFKKSAI